MSNAKSAWSKDTLERMVEGRMSEQESFLLQTEPKDLDRFERVIAVLQEQVSWPEKILVPLGEHLYVVEKENGERVAKCDCGHEFGDYRENWKLNALVYARDTREKLNEIYVGERACDPDWMILREYYCPGCATMLEVENVTPGYPVVFNFLPDLEAFEKNQGR
jgi:acetone carboxylase gamma subunit